MAASKYEHYYEDTFTIPRKDIGAGVHGFAIDFGGSLTKVAYITPSQKDQDPVAISLISFPSKNMDDVLAFIKTTLVDPLKGKKDPKFFAYTCGVSGLMHREQITKTLAPIELNDIIEFDCFARGLQYGLLKKSPEEFISFTGYVCSRNAPEGKAIPVDQLMGIAMMNIKNDNGAKEAAEAQLPLFPCLICFAGSAFAMMKVYEDGTYETLLPLNRGGIYFYGLGKLLTNCKSYEDLMSMAQKGDASTVSMTVKDFPPGALKQGDMDFTDVLMDELFCSVGLPFSKIVRGGPDVANPKKEDVANTLLHTVCGDLVLQCVNNARRKGCQRVYLCGSFCKNNPLLEAYVKRIELSELGMNDPLLVMSILKFEGYIGSIGNLLRAAEDLAKKE